MPATRKVTPRTRQAESAARRGANLFGDGLKIARPGAGYQTMQEACNKLGMAHPNWSKYENGLQEPGWSTGVRIITGLGLALECFFPSAAILAAADRLRGAGAGRGNSSGNPAKTAD
jgi:transcriptional regulator with XRE-family HTH domain